MAILGDILRRFRFHGVPGAPSTIGVPADRTAELEAELTPVLAALDDSQRRAIELVSMAEHQAAQRRAAATEQGRRVIANARARAGPARAEAAAERLAVAEPERTKVLSTGVSEAERIWRLAGERTPALADRVVALVLALGAPTDEPT